MRSFVILVLFCLALTGCATNPSDRTTEAIKTQTVYITMPDAILAPCLPDKPISTQEYMSKKINERETHLTNYTIGLLKVIDTCNLQLKKARELNKPPLTTK